MSSGTEVNPDFGTHVIRHVAGVIDSAGLIDEILVNSSSERFSVSRELMETLSRVLRGDAKLIMQLFEENELILNRVAKAMEKNHPKGYTVKNTER